MATFYTIRLAKGEHVVWNRRYSLTHFNSIFSIQFSSKNPAPWLSVQQNQTTKMYRPNGDGHFKEKWERKEL